MMSWIMKHVLTHIFLTELTSLSATGACVLSGRIKSNDSDVMVSQTDQPCTLTLTARNNKQVVVVMYDMLPDCVEKGTVAIYDGRSTRGTLLTDVCQEKPWSFASRTYSLTLAPVSSNLTLRPFSLDTHTFDTVKTFTSSTGIIRSDRYKSGPNVFTTPNNLHVFYRIVVGGNVTVKIFFKEFDVQHKNGETCPDFVKIHGVTPSTELCSQGNLPPNVSTFSDNLSIEFKTDSSTAYTGFVVEYVVNQTSSADIIDDDGTMDTGEQTLGYQRKNTTIIIVAALGSISVVVIVTVAVFVVRQRLSRVSNEKTTAVRKENGNRTDKFEASKDDVDIYVGNEEYDHLRMNRKHTKSSNNLYEGTFGSSDEYAVVNRTH